MLYSVSPITLSAIKQQSGEMPLRAAAIVQVQSRALKQTKDNKPYCELGFADTTGHCLLKIWSNAPEFAAAEQLTEGSILCVEAEWTRNAFGLNSRNLTWQPASDEAIASFFIGDPELREKQERDYGAIVDYCESIRDPRLRALCGNFLEQLGARFRRTAAARRNHHARRGGLVEHVAQMMRSTAVLVEVYPELNRDLLMAGVLFHDCGKLWENAYPEQGFSQIHSLHGEMLGHIPMGIELVNKLWRDVMETAEADGWSELLPPCEEVRLHLLHLVGSHHGQYEFGSPVLPRTPEAFALHYIDNLDAKLEMLRETYQTSQEIAPGVYDRVFPLPTSLVRPLAAVVLPTVGTETPDVPAQEDDSLSS
jgi:3'-5' exoribonuclease